jgi:putative DNA primase/helicase
MSLKSCSADEAVAWIKAFLAAHPGVGSCDGDVTDDDGTPASAAQCQAYLDVAVDVVGAADAKAYAESRGLSPPYPACVYIPHARCGEGGFAGLLTSHEHTVGLLVLYITPDGKKSTVTPLRRRFMLEKALDAVFGMPYSGTNSDVVICEGLEDSLSVYRYAAQRCRIIGLPGIGTLRHLVFTAGTKVTIVADGDPVGSPGRKALEAGIDHLMLSGVDVYVTEIPPLGFDANRILQEGGVKELQNFLDRVTPATLSLEGEVEKLARLPMLDYGKVRKIEAKRLGIPVGMLDAAVKKAQERIAAAAQTAPADDEDWGDIADTPVWLTPIDGKELLDELVNCISEYIVMRPVQCSTVALWVLFTYLFEIAYNLPKLRIKSAERRSGKTRLLELLKHLTPRALATNYISAAMLPRVITKFNPTLLMDEVDTFVNLSEEMRGILNSGFDREQYVIIGVKVGDDWVPTKFNAWCPQALAGIGDLHDTITDRSFMIELERKPRDRKVKRLRRRDTAPLQILAQKCARWAEDHTAELEDVEPVMPDGLDDRAADAWELCIAVADLVSVESGDETWSKRARQAALAISGDQVSGNSVGEMLLSDIRDIFEEMLQETEEPVERNKQRIASNELVLKLNQLIDRPWPEFCKGQRLTQATLARLLKEFHISPNLSRVNKIPTRSYHRTAFEQAFKRYLPPLADPGRKTHAHPYTSSTKIVVTSSLSEEKRGFKGDFKVLHETRCNTSKTPESSSNTANCNDVTAILAKDIEGCVRENFGTDGSAQISWLSDCPNGHDDTAPSFPTKPIPGVEEKILQVWREHPDWSFRKIGRECAVTPKRAQRVIAAVKTAEKGAQ